MELQTKFEEFKKRDVQLLSVTIEVPESNKRMRKATGVHFEILSDEAGKLIDHFGMRHVKGKRGQSDLAQSSSFLLDHSGRVLWQRIAENYRVRPKPEEILRAIDTLDTARAAATIDHHVHILGPNLIRDWKSLGVPFSRPDSIYFSPASLFANTDSMRTALRQAVLVPMAHLYGNTEFREALKLSLEQEHERVRAENDHVAREAERFAEKAIALCSVNFLRPYAWEEILRCRREHRAPAVKLHLASAETDLRNIEHLNALKRIVAWADSEHVGLLLHFDPQRRGLTIKDVEHFIATVLEPSPNLQILIAHLGGSGGYGAWTQSVFRCFTDWLARAQHTNVYFDLSAVILEQESEGVPATTSEEAMALATDLRRAGLQRVTFASDYPVFDPNRYLRVLRERTSLTESELVQITRNRTSFWMK